MPEQVELSTAAAENLEKLKDLVPGVDSENLIETALAITQALFEKSSAGVQIRLVYPEGQEEELRFKVKKPVKKKPVKDGDL
jgi:hypothetical protein